MAAAADRLHVLGVRHHGPGSAAAVVRALDAADPAEVLVEGPPDADGMIAHVTRGLRPPVALLVHSAAEPARAVFYPFAAWSPEWQALRWAVARGRPARFIDRPIAARLRDDDAEDLPPRGDPLGRLAEVDGASDGEAWWGALVEEADGDVDLFARIEDAMAALRDADGVRAEDDLREAYMRAAVDDALDRADGPVAAVVGAWHAPALRSPRDADAALLRGDRRREKVEATWAPWTDARLALASGYGAGVTAPGWYRALWEGRGLGGRALAIRWQTGVARALRGHRRTAPPSSVIDAVRLAEALAALRDRPRPGLDELRDASLATLCAGDEVTWALVARDVLVGTAIGEVPDGVPSTPLAADLARQQRQLKLAPSAEARELAVDLRSANGLKRSQLLHRLRLLDVPWGVPADPGGSRGTFRERWTLAWEPELSVKLAEALRWGTTVAGASASRTVARLQEGTALPELADLVRAALDAGLDDAARAGVRRLDEVAAGGADVAALCATVPPLVDVLRYGTARALSVDGVEELVGSMLDRIRVGAVHAARDLDHAAAAALRDALTALDAAVPRFQAGARAEEWTATLGDLADDDGAARLIAGFAARRLRDRGAWPDDRIAAALAASLSPGVPLPDAAGWLEGFLGDAGHVLVHDATLLALVDAWLAGLADDALVEVLPLLRRATSTFSGHQRKQILGMVAGQGPRATAPAVAASSQALDDALPLLAAILGLEAP